MGWFSDAWEDVVNTVSNVDTSVSDFVSNPVSTTADVGKEVFGTGVSGVKKIESGISDQATLKNLSYVAPESLFFTDAGRKALANTYGPLIAPVASIAAPGAGGVIAGAIGTSLASNTASGGDPFSFLSSLFSGASASPAPIQKSVQTQPAVVSGGGYSNPGVSVSSGVNMPLVIGIGVAALVGVVLIARRK